MYNKLKFEKVNFKLIYFFFIAKDRIIVHENIFVILCDDLKTLLINNEI